LSQSDVIEATSPEEGIDDDDEDDDEDEWRGNLNIRDQTRVSPRF